MTEPTNEPLTILAEHIANAGTFALIEEEISTAVNSMDNSQATRDRLQLEPGDVLPEPIILGVVVAFGDEASIIWHQTVDSLHPVIAADFMVDIQNAADLAYRKARDKMADHYDKEDDQPDISDIAITTPSTEPQEDQAKG